MTTDQYVLSLADEWGTLPMASAMRVCSDHNVSVGDAWEELGDAVTDAAALLTWLGY